MGQGLRRRKKADGRWDAVNWKIIGDAEADIWLDRPRRDPWQLPKV